MQNANNTTIEYESGDLEDCVIRCHEARMARTKNSYDLITDLCKRVDALVNKTLDECGGNQAVSRVIDDLKACMKASIVTHLSKQISRDRIQIAPKATGLLPARLLLSEKKHPLPRSLPKASAERQSRRQHITHQRRI